MLVNVVTAVRFYWRCTEVLSRTDHFVFNYVFFRFSPGLMLFIPHMPWNTDVTWWRHQMDTISALLALCTVTGEFPSQRPVTRSFDVFVLICTWIVGWVNNRENGDLRRHRAHYGVTVMKFPYLQALPRGATSLKLPMARGSLLSTSSRPQQSMTPVSRAAPSRFPTTPARCSSFSTLAALYRCSTIPMALVSWWIILSHKSHIYALVPHICTSPISHNAPLCNRNVHISVTK